MTQTHFILKSYFFTPPLPPPPPEIVFYCLIIHIFQDPRNIYTKLWWLASGGGIQIFIGSCPWGLKKTLK